jgi:hypothetical protein
MPSMASCRRLAASPHAALREGFPEDSRRDDRSAPAGILIFVPDIVANRDLHISRSICRQAATNLAWIFSKDISSPRKEPESAQFCSTVMQQSYQNHSTIAELHVVASSRMVE